MLKMEKKWELPVEAAPEKIKEIATLFNLSEAVVKVLFNRGFYQAETIKDFLGFNPTPEEVAIIEEQGSERINIIKYWEENLKNLGIISKLGIKCSSIS